MNVRHFDLNLLVILHALLMERSVTRAAKRVHLSQPATSNALKRLRDVFNDPLMVRGARAMELTPRALSLLAPVQNALRDVSELLAYGQKFEPATAQLTLHIAVSEYVAFVLMPPLLQDIRASAPGIRLVVRDVDRQNPLGALRDGKVDLLAAFVPDPPHDLSVRTLFSDTWVCIHRKGVGARGKQLTRSAFASANHVSLPQQAGGSGSAAYLQRIFKENGIATRVAVSMPHYLSIPQLVSSTDLVMTIPRRLALELARQMPLAISRLPLDAAGFEISMLWHERTEADVAQVWFRERLVSAAREVQAREARRGNARRSVRRQASRTALKR